MVNKTQSKIILVGFAIAVCIALFVFAQTYLTTAVATSFCKTLVTSEHPTMKDLDALDVDGVDSNGDIVHPKQISFYLNSRKRIRGCIGKLETIEIRGHDLKVGVTNVYVTLHGSTPISLDLTIRLASDGNRWKVADVRFPEDDK